MEYWKKKYENAIIGIKAVYENADASTRAALETKFPELAESEDEKIRKHLLMHFKAKTKSTWCNMPVKDIISYLEKLKDFQFGYPGLYFYDGEKLHFQGNPAMEEKQKEQPKEELVYRMNGLMQEYVKAGEDDAEREHRMKCYQLFWDALEDADFFEQKEQKPVEIHIDNPNIQQFDPDVKVTTSDSSASGKELLYVSNKSYNIGYRDGVNSVKPAELSEEDERMLSRCIKSIECSKMFAETDTFKEAKDKEIDWLTKRLKSLRPQPHWKPSAPQMRALREAVDEWDGFAGQPTLESLYNDLKKLL